MKKSLGYQFLKKFINLREKNPNTVCSKVIDFLKEHKITNWYLEIDAKRFLLFRQFFGEPNTNILFVNPTAKSDTVLIGKGVCYDSGGYSIKGDMKDMHYDKNGALLAIAAAIDNNTPALVFFTNNLIDRNSVLPGEILLESLTKRRVLITDTDAEGRIGLANLIAYADKELHFNNIITIATLTGSACGMVGERTYAVIHSNDRKDYTFFINQVIEGRADWWPGSFHKDYDNSIKTKVKGAHIANYNSKYRYAGSSTAFSFLKAFTNKHLTHLDIAPMMLDKNGNGLIWGLKEIKILVNFLTKG